MFSLKLFIFRLINVFNWGLSIYVYKFGIKECMAFPMHTLGFLKSMFQKLCAPYTHCEPSGCTLSVVCDLATQVATLKIIIRNLEIVLTLSLNLWCALDSDSRMCVCTSVITGMYKVDYIWIKFIFFSNIWNFKCVHKVRSCHVGLTVIMRWL